MSRVDELAEMVYERAFVHDKAPHEIAAMIAQLYASELRRKMRERMSRLIDGDAPQHDAAITQCISIVDETAP